MLPNNTERLISRLVADLRPITTLHPPVSRCILWCTGALILVCVVVHYLGGLRPDIHLIWYNPSFVFDTILLLMACITASLAAFSLAIPDTTVRFSIKLLLVVATMSLLVLCSRAFFMSDVFAEMRMGDFDAGSHHCLMDLTIMLLAPLFSVFFMLRRGATTFQLLPGYAATLAAASGAALGMRFFCPLDGGIHLLIWHFSPVVTYAVGGAVIGQKFLKW